MAEPDEPLTEELLAELLKAPDVESFIETHSPAGRDLPGYLAGLLQAKGLRQSKVVRAANLSPTYGYQIFAGTRHPSREKLLAIAFAMGLSVREANRLLQVGGVSALYAKDRRDAIIIFCLDHGKPLLAVNEQLHRLGEATIDSFSGYAG